MKKMPPIEKIYEAYSAIADGRVSLFDSSARVISSSGDKEYAVTWGRTETGQELYSSNDNATYWQGYAGYPVIAVLMLQGKLPLDEGIMGMFKAVNWAELNAAARRDYARALEDLFNQRNYSDEERTVARREAECVHETLGELDIQIRRGSKRPPRS